MTGSGFVQPLLRYIAENHLDGRAEVERDTPLLEWGVIDSLALTDLMEFVESRFGIAIPTAEITPENFRTVADLAALLQRLSAASEVAPAG